MKDARFENADPILVVADMAAALRFYVDILGFNNAEWGDETFTNVAREQASVYLCRGDQGLGKAWVWMGVEDVRPIYEHLKAHNWPIKMEPTNFPWALEIHVEDPDGNTIRFGSDPEE
jgi:catechol 2,3-dioxygenase-like lactoylglutathione lyase family enzyme